MLTVGIHENLVMSQASLNDKGTLGIVFRPKRLSGPVAKKSFFEESQGSDYTDNDSENSPLLIFPFKVTTRAKQDGGEYTDPEKVELLEKDINTFREQLICMMSAYMPVKGFNFDPYRNTGINKDNYAKEFLDADQLAKVYNNYCETFISTMAPFLDNDEYPVRLKLIRQSKDKHYATLPKMYVKDNPFIEPMTVPKEASLLKYTNWEKNNGFDDGTPVKQSAADPIPEATPEAAANVFGAR